MGATSPPRRPPASAREERFSRPTSAAGRLPVVFVRFFRPAVSLAGRERLGNAAARRALLAGVPVVWRPIRLVAPAAVAVEGLALATLAVSVRAVVRLEAFAAFVGAPADRPKALDVAVLVRVRLAAPAFPATDATELCCGFGALGRPVPVLPLAATLAGATRRFGTSPVWLDAVERLVVCDFEPGDPAAFLPRAAAARPRIVGLFALSVGSLAIGLPQPFSPSANAISRGKAPRCSGAHGLAAAHGPRLPRRSEQASRRSVALGATHGRRPHRCKHDEGLTNCLRPHQRSR
jgi:hypothetical protein